MHRDDEHTYDSLTSANRQTVAGSLRNVSDQKRVAVDASPLTQCNLASQHWRDARENTQFRGRLNDQNRQTEPDYEDSTVDRGGRSPSAVSETCSPTPAGQRIEAMAPRRSPRLSAHNYLGYPFVSYVFAGFQPIMNSLGSTETSRDLLSPEDIS